MKRLFSGLLCACLLTGPAAHAQDDDEDEDADEASDPATILDAPTITSGRVSFIAGGALLVGGFGLGYLAQGQAQRAGKLTSARGARDELRAAQSTAQTANLMYALAGAAIIYGLALEILPEPIADKANLTFHF